MGQVNDPYGDESVPSWQSALNDNSKPRPSPYVALPYEPSSEPYYQVCAHVTLLSFHTLKFK